MSAVERTFDAQIEYELANIPPEMFLPYDGEMLGDDETIGHELEVYEAYDGPLSGDEV
jgi:hypothetical protein